MSKTRKVTKSTKRRLRVFGVLSLVCILNFLVTVGYEIYQVYSLKQEQTNLKEEYKDLKKEAKELEIEIEELYNPEYLAKYAREKYSYSKDGEYIIKIKESEKEIEKVDKELNSKYIGIGISIFVLIIFIFILKKVIKNCKKMFKKRRKKMIFVEYKK